MRDGEIAAQSLGIDLLTYKATAFALSSFYAGVAGALYSGLLGFVSPEAFDLFQMIIQKAMIVVGGLGSVVGAVLGARSSFTWRYFASSNRPRRSCSGPCLLPLWCSSPMGWLCS